MIKNHFIYIYIKAQIKSHCVKTKKSKKAKRLHTGYKQKREAFASLFLFKFLLSQPEE